MFGEYCKNDTDCSFKNCQKNEDYWLIFFFFFFFVSVRYVFSAKDIGKYFELDNISKDTYFLFSDKECIKTYI